MFERRQKFGSAPSIVTYRSIPLGKRESLDDQRTGFAVGCAAFHSVGQAAESEGGTE